MDRELENYFFEKFRHHLPCFPLGRYFRSESPDFIVDSPDYKIGIEITEVFQDSHLKHSKLQERVSVRHRLTMKLIQRLQEKVDFTFHVNIHFSDHYPLSKKEDKILSKLFECCTKPLRSLENEKYFIIEDFKVLPKEVDSIRINRYDGLEESFDEMPDGGIVSNLQDKHLKSILEKKDLKLKKYQQCDRYWLLIVQGNYYAGDFKELEINLPVNSQFDRVFLFRTKEDKIIELK